jgi:hypothetical protein
LFWSVDEAEWGNYTARWNVRRITLSLRDVGKTEIAWEPASYTVLREVDLELFERILIWTVIGMSYNKATCGKAIFV